MTFYLQASASLAQQAKPLGAFDLRSIAHLTARNPLGLQAERNQGLGVPRYNGMHGCNGMLRWLSDDVTASVAIVAAVS